MIVSTGIHIDSKEMLSDDIAEPISKELNRLIEKQVKQIVKDISASSGFELEVRFT